MWILAIAEDPSRLAPYGPGYVELFSLFSLFAPSGPLADKAIFWTNVVLSSLAAPLLYGLGRSLGLSSRLAWVAGFFVALDAVSIRMGATEAYFPAIIAFTLAASLSYSYAARAALLRRWSRGVCFLIAGFLFATQAARLHPIAWGPALASSLSMGPAALVWLEGREGAGAKRSILWALVMPSLASFAMAALFLATTPGTLLRMTGHVSNHFGIRQSLSMLGAQLADLAGLPLLIGLLLALRLARPKALLWPAILCGMAAMATYKIYGQSDLWLRSYLRIWLAFPLLAAIALIPRAFARKQSFPLASALLAAAALLWDRQTLLSRTTEQEEYQFFRAALQTLPPDCQLAYCPRKERRVVLLPEQMLPKTTDGKRRVLHIEQPEELEILRQGSACFAYAHTSLCSSEEGRPICNQIEKNLSPKPQSQTQLKAKPSYDGLPYDTEQVNISLSIQNSP